MSISASRAAFGASAGAAAFVVFFRSRKAFEVPVSAFEVPTARVDRRVWTLEEADEFEAASVATFVYSRMKVVKTQLGSSRSALQLTFRVCTVGLISTALFVLVV
jgi:hypothetical protein